jgi:hypothetical protein
MLTLVADTFASAAWGGARTKPGRGHPPKIPKTGNLQTVPTYALTSSLKSLDNGRQPYSLFDNRIANLGAICERNGRDNETLLAKCQVLSTNCCLPATSH